MTRLTLYFGVNYPFEYIFLFSIWQLSGEFICTSTNNIHNVCLFVKSRFTFYLFFSDCCFLLVLIMLPQKCTAFYSLLSYFLAGRVVSAFHGSCDPGGAPAQRSVSLLNVPPWTALYSGWASACLSLACMWGTRHVVGALILQFATTCEDSMPCRAVAIRRMKSDCPANQSLGDRNHRPYYRHVSWNFGLTWIWISIYLSIDRSFFFFFNR